MNLKILNLTKQQESNIKLILSNQLDPKEFSSVKFWIGQCYNLPSLDEQKMCAFNQILFGFGKIKKGTNIYYWPSSHEVFCTNCGDAPYRQFLSSAADEDVYNGSGNPYAW